MMVMKAGADGSFLKMKESCSKFNAFCKGICITFFIHVQCGQIIRMRYTLFFQFCKYKDPVCSEFTAKQCIYLELVFAFTYSVIVFIIVGNHNVQFFLSFLTFSICPQLAAHCNFFNSVLHQASSLTRLLHPGLLLLAIPRSILGAVFQFSNILILTLTILFVKISNYSVL